jgi:3-deoxy-D-manno-octulosonic-acid transferase
MKLNTYIAIQLMLLIFRLFLSPFIRILALFIPALRRRFEFEKRNDGLRSFKDDGEIAHSCFHVSSEGELEQCLYIISDLLDQGKKIELIYTSNSVERKCTELDRKYELLRTFRFSPLSFPFRKFNDYVSAKRLYMCRYDFFSEIMLYGASKDVDFTLLSASLKNKEDKFNFVMAQKFSLYNKIYAASARDVELFKKLNPSLNVSEFEFRVLQIAKRIESSDNTLSQKPQMDNLVEFLKSRDISKNIVLGSAWPSEMEIFENKNFISAIKSGEYSVVIAPHGLSETFIDDICKHLPKELSFQVLEKDKEVKDGVVLINPFPGVLVESYKFFGHCFVGGGHGRSVHSLLEPYLAGGMVYCGPKTHRSTEYDFVKSRGEESLKVVGSLSSFFDQLSFIDRKKGLTKVKEIVDNYFSEYKKILDNL